MAKWFHWTIFFLLLFMIIYGYSLGQIPKEYKGFAFNIHKLTGLLILGLMSIRLLTLFFNPKPVSLNTRSYEKFLERLVHSLLYVVVILMPLIGWIGSSGAGRYPHIGNLEFVLPVPHDKNMVSKAFDLHSLLAIVLIVLVSLHVLAALYHHFVKRDKIFKRMLPGEKVDINQISV